MKQPPKICEVCRNALDVEVSGSGAGYVHPVRMGQVDHEPRPVSPPSDWRGVCDFCRFGSAAWVLPVKDFTTPIGTQSGGGWAACDDCAALIERNQWNALIRRVVADIPEYQSVTAQTNLKTLYRLVRKNTAGAITAL